MSMNANSKADWAAWMIPRGTSYPGMNDKDTRRDGEYGAFLSPAFLSDRAPELETLVSAFSLERDEADEVDVRVSRVGRGSAIPAFF